MLPTVARPKGDRWRPTPVPPRTFTTRARVDQFTNEEGWGVLDAPGGVAPGGIWFYWSVIDVPGYKTVSVGHIVEADVEVAEQDGYHFRALHVRLVVDESRRAR